MSPPVTRVTSKSRLCAIQLPKVTLPSAGVFEELRESVRHYVGGPAELVSSESDAAAG